MEIFSIGVGEDRNFLEIDFNFIWQEDGSKIDRYVLLEFKDIFVEI